MVSSIKGLVDYPLSLINYSPFIPLLVFFPIHWNQQPTRAIKQFHTVNSTVPELKSIDTCSDNENHLEQYAICCIRFLPVIKQKRMYRGILLLL